MARGRNWIDDLQYIMWCKAWGHRFRNGKRCVWCGIRRYPYAATAVVAVAGVTVKTLVG